MPSSTPVWGALLSSAAGRTPSSVSVKWKKKKKKKDLRPGRASVSPAPWCTTPADGSQRPGRGNPGAPSSGRAGWGPGLEAGAGERGAPLPSSLPSPSPPPLIYIYVYVFFFSSQVLLPRYPPLNPKAPRDWVLGPGTSVGL